MALHELLIKIMHIYVILDLGAASDGNEML